MASSTTEFAVPDKVREQILDDPRGAGPALGLRSADHIGDRHVTSGAIRLRDRAIAGDAYSEGYKVALADLRALTLLSAEQYAAAYDAAIPASVEGQS